MSYRMSADIGGTFTDIVLVDDEKRFYKTNKVLTTPNELEKGILTGFDQIVGEEIGGDFSQITSIVFGTTSGLNAIIERRGAKCAMVTTRGFRDVYEIARGNRPEIYNIHYRKPTPLIPRKDIFEVNERINARGCVDERICESELIALADTLREYESIAICFINSYINPENERKTKEILGRELGDGIVITISSEIAQEAKEYERVSTIALNAYVAPKTKRHIEALSAELKKRNFSGTLYMMQSSGGVIRAELAAETAVKTLMSGPVGGAIGASFIDRRNIIGFDIGGTSFDVSVVVDGSIETTLESTIEGFPALTPTVNVFSIGAGGGSIAWEEAGGMRVGPQSAGANPGPVCYDHGGTEPTITDANLILGHLAARYFLGGRMRINREKTVAAMRAYGAKFGMDEVTVAEGVCMIANHKMADAIRELTVKRGIDPRTFSILAFGGAGPMHAALIADMLDIEEVIIPPDSGVFSAWGMLQADIRHDSVRTKIGLLQTLTEADYRAAFEQQYDDLARVLAKEGIPVEKAKFAHSLDMRYLGQEYTISVGIPDDIPYSAETIEAMYNSAYERLYGHHSVDDVIEVVNYRLTVTAAVNSVPVCSRRSDKPLEAIDTQTGYFSGRACEMRVYPRAQLVTGRSVVGPAIVEELTTTTVIPPDWKVEVDGNDNMIMRKICR